MQETWVWSLDQEDPLEKDMATHSSILGGAWWATVHGVTKSPTWLSGFTTHPEAVRNGRGCTQHTRNRRESLNCFNLSFIIKNFTIKKTNKWKKPKAKEKHLLLSGEKLKVLPLKIQIRIASVSTLFTVKKDQKRKEKWKHWKENKKLSSSADNIIVFRENPEEFHIHGIGMCISFVVA